MPGRSTSGFHQPGRRRGGDKVEPVLARRGGGINNTKTKVIESVEVGWIMLVAFPHEHPSRHIYNRTAPRFSCLPVKGRVHLI